MSQEQKDLVEVLDSVHNALRLKKKQAKDEEEWKRIWEEHTSDFETLQAYSSAMHKLATKVWEPRNVTAAEGESSLNDKTKLDSGDKQGKVKCRLEWVVNHCQDYFKLQEEGRLKLLDVGSCYNPFSKFSKYFEITALDLCPAPGFEQEVFQCDFLDLEVKENSQGVFASDDDIPLDKHFRKLTSLPKSSFDVVVFSFFLGYLADPQQRLECCRKAHNLLKENGLLFVLNPDSNKVTPTGNSCLVKRMKLGMTILGFKRIYFEKLEHLWCMAFQKLEEKEMKACLESGYFKKDVEKAGIKRLLEDQTDLHELFHIAQDSKEFETDRLSLTTTTPTSQSEFDAGLSDELPKGFC